jgi:hypothetical protein
MQPESARPLVRWELAACGCHRSDPTCEFVCVHFFWRTKWTAASNFGAAAWCLWRCPRRRPWPSPSRPQGFWATAGRMKKRAIVQPLRGANELDRQYPPHLTSGPRRWADCAKKVKIEQIRGNLARSAYGSSGGINNAINAGSSACKVTDSSQYKRQYSLPRQGRWLEHNAMRIAGISGSTLLASQNWPSRRGYRDKGNMRTRTRHLNLTRVAFCSPLLLPIVIPIHQSTLIAICSDGLAQARSITLPLTNSWCVRQSSTLRSLESRRTLRRR